MRIKTENLKWVLVVGVPIICVACLGAAVELIGWEWMENKCEQWIREMKGER